MSSDRKSIFEKIIDREIPADIVYEDKEILAFKDINPAAPKHFLVIPKKKIVNLQMAEPEDIALIGKIMVAIQQIAVEQGLDKNGYRVVTNVGEYGGQTVYHLHFHVLGGRPLHWPPG